MRSKSAWVVASRSSGEAPGSARSASGLNVPVPACGGSRCRVPAASARRCTFKGRAARSQNPPLEMACEGSRRPRQRLQPVLLKRADHHGNDRNRSCLHVGGRTRRIASYPSSPGRRRVMRIRSGPRPRRPGPPPHRWSPPQSGARDAGTRIATGGPPHRHHNRIRYGGCPGPSPVARQWQASRPPLGAGATSKLKVVLAQHPDADVASHQPHETAADGRPESPSPCPPSAASLRLLEKPEERLVRRMSSTSPTS